MSVTLKILQKAGKKKNKDTHILVNNKLFSYMYIWTYFLISDFIEMLHFVNRKSFSLALLSVKVTPTYHYFLPFAHNLSFYWGSLYGGSIQPPLSDIKIPKSSQLETSSSHITLLKNAFIIYFLGVHSELS